MYKTVLASGILLSILTTGCSLFKTKPDLTPLPPAQSLGEATSGYTYVPIDPFPVVSIPGDDCGKSPPYDYVTLPDALPDNAVRMLIESLDISGNITYLTSKAAAQNQRYRVTVDYINADTINVPIWLSLTMNNAKTGDAMYVDPISPPGANAKAGTERYHIITTPPTKDDMAGEPGLQSYNIPVYVGIGLRVSANIYTVGANVNISGIGVIGAEADAQHLTGSLIVQTLGVNGKSIEAALPIQSDLNRTTAENAIVAVGTIKALLYASDTQKKERIVGIYLPFSGGQALVNALISALSQNPVRWARPCAIPAAPKVAAQPDAGKPAPAKSEAAKQASAKPEVGKPAPAKPEAASPESPNAGTTNSDVAKPGAREPAKSNPVPKGHAPKPPGTPESN